MWKIVDSTQSLVLIINQAVPYYVAGVAVAIGFKMNLFNIGVDGQYRLATLFAAWVGASISLPAPLHVAHDRRRRDGGRGRPGQRSPARSRSPAASTR